MSMRPCVHLVDDDARFREAAARWLRVAGLAAMTYLAPQAFLDTYDPERPGCLVTEARLRGLSGLALASMLGQHPCPLPVVMVAADADVALAVAALRQGAVDFLEKPLAPGALIDSVHRALAHDERQRRRAVQRAALEARYAALSDREREVLDRIVGNASAKRIAQELRLSPRTVEHHREHVMAKMGARSWHELVVMAILLGRYEPRLPP
jgi:two-component system response regulator FixJ